MSLLQVVQPKKISAGKAVRIFTGACIPEGANKVIIQENVKVLPKDKD